jgi:BirA family biotin operon repressor/biotin-[acetyl-CoA-carboxylase] ligase
MKLIWFDSIDSTQDYIKSHIKELMDDTCVLSNIQTKGRGRYGHVWFSSLKEGLYFSILKKNLHIEPSSLVVGVSLFKTIKTLYDIRAFIKWPNDIYVLLEKPRKVAGILVEKIKENTIIGIGVNLNQEDFPQDISDRAISLKLFTGKYISKQLFLTTFFDFFYEDIDYFNFHGFEDFRNIINDNLLYKNRLITANDGKISGILKEVDKEGFLVIEKDNTLISLNAGEIESMIPKETW